MKVADPSRMAMTIPYQIDPTLHGGPPAPATLGDGFEPPRREHEGSGEGVTHPVEPEPGDDGRRPEPGAPTPTRLPIEPEFRPEAEPVEPEDPPLRRKPQP